MIQLNLLPDVKLEYIKAQRARRLVFSISILAAIVSIVILLLLLSADGLQKKHLKDLDSDIGSETHQLQHEPQIGKMLTVQNQLERLTSLHSNKPAADRLFGYLNQVTPVTVAITELNIDFSETKISVTGTSDSLASVNQYIDTLKNTTFAVKGGSNGQSAFDNVVLSSFSLNTDSQGSGQAANYTIDLSYNNTIFNVIKNIQLSVPSETITRPNTTQPTDLFQAAPATKGAQ